MYYHLPGLFEFYEFYKMFLPLFREHRDWFYDWCEIGSIYGAPGDCLWGGGRVGFGDAEPKDVIKLLNQYGISARLTFSNSLLEEEHLADKQCNALCRLFSENTLVQNGIIITSDLLLQYISNRYSQFYFVSSTTKVITDLSLLKQELNREEFRFVVPDFRFNKKLDVWNSLTKEQLEKVELLVNECCYFGCQDRKKCYESVSRKALGIEEEEHICQSPGAEEGYVFSKAMKNPGFISVEDIRKIYVPMGISHFKIEGRSLGSALLLEFILYYMTKPECVLLVREAIYLNHSLDLF